MQIVCLCIDEVPGLFLSLIAEDHGGVLRSKNTIDKYEKEADQIKNRLRAHLPKSLFMPVNRTDLLQVLQMQDAIADVAQDIASLLVARKTEVPNFMQRSLLSLIQRCVDACHQSAKVIGMLDELLAVGFQGAEADRVRAMVEKLCEMESETDTLGRELVHQLFQHEDELKPVSVVFWYLLIEWIGDIADYAENVGDRVRLLVAT